MSCKIEQSEAASWTEGRWSTAPSGTMTGVGTDTRALQPGCLFVALVGPHFDGHDYVAQAVQAGAAAVMVAENRAGVVPPEVAALLVPDTRKALAKLAAGYRRTVPARYVGITGSVGKTTVKELLAGILSRLGPTARTHANWNNDIGLPLSLLRMPPNTEYGVFEVGTNHPGEIGALSSILAPDVGVMTTVGAGHVEFFASERAVAEEKASLIKSLGRDGVAILSRDQAWYAVLSGAAACKVVTVSLKDDADYIGHWDSARPDVLELKGTATSELLKLTLPVPSRFMAENVLLCAAAARQLGAEWDDVVAGLRSYRSPRMRWERVEQSGIHFINDAYNANPMSMRAALEALAGTAWQGSTWLVLGSMFELGDSAEREHLELGRLAASGPWRGLITVGKLGTLIADGARAAGMVPSFVVACADVQEAAEAVAERAQVGDRVLLKGSRGEALERILDILKTN